MAGLVDTNVRLSFRLALSVQEKISQRTVAKGPGRGLPAGAPPGDCEVCGCCQPLTDGRGSILSPEDARREAEELLNQFEILYPNESIVRLALRAAAAAYQLAWFDAHLWAYAEHYGLAGLISEDFEHDRLYGTVRCVNPFR